MHLISFHQGNSSESLVQALLAQIGFFSTPNSGMNDIGIDYFFTLGKEIQVKKSKYLTPSYSFAVQVKSNNRRIKLSRDMLMNLFVPYIVIVVSKRKLSIYKLKHFHELFVSKGSQIAEKIIVDFSFTPSSGQRFKWDSEKGEAVLGMELISEFNEVVFETPTDKDHLRSTLIRLAIKNEQELISRKGKFNYFDGILYMGPESDWESLLLNGARQMILEAKHETYDTSGKYITRSNTIDHIKCSKAISIATQIEEYCSGNTKHKAVLESLQWDRKYFELWLSEENSLSDK